MPALRKATDTPMGFWPDSAPVQIGPCTVDSGAAIIYPGDVVILEADGGLAIGAAGSVNCVGTAAQYNAASTAASAFLVYDAVGQVYVGQDDSAAGIMTATALGATVDLLATTGNTTTRLSLQELDSSTASTTATLVFKVKALHPIEGGSYGSAAGEWRQWQVTINNHLYAGYPQVGI